MTMREHSPTAWNIASRYSSVLASETRDLAAHIDAALARERERCAKIADRIGLEADRQAEGLSYGDLYGMQSRSDAAEEIAAAIRALSAHTPADGSQR
jgi:hypothetical protein